ncbi:hypothetical protein HOY80DRAFT_1033256 [Tuber brumale]|nr:hypothetical protein HOY80DRAFT_1033256 [Tuber brumale]
MSWNTNRVSSTVAQASATSRRSSTGMINVDTPPRRAQVPVDSFVADNIKDIDDDSDDA